MCDWSLGRWLRGTQRDISDVVLPYHVLPNDMAAKEFLVNNAGIDSAAPFDRMTEENFDRLFLVHFKGVYFLT